MSIYIHIPPPRSPHLFQFRKLRGPVVGSPEGALLRILLLWSLQAHLSDLYVKVLIYNIMYVDIMCIYIYIMCTISMHRERDMNMI